MHRIRCPFCGMRDEAEFRYRGDATVARPEPAAGDSDDAAETEAFLAYVYARDNPRGWHLEWWHHAGGCRRVVKVQRHTLTHAIAWTGWASEPAPPPPPDAAS